MTTVRGPVWFVARRLATLLMTLIGLVTIVFIMIRLIPGDEAQVAAGAGATPEQVQQMRVRLGLDQPVVVQYGHYLAGLVHGDLGTSVVSHRPVASDIGAVLPATLQLGILSLTLSLLVAVPLATVSAARRGSGSDMGSRVTLIVAAGLPTFWLALLLQWLFGATWRILPVSGSLSPGLRVSQRSGMTLVDTLLAGNLPAFQDAARHLMLPALVLSILAAAQFYRFLRAEMLAVLQREHIMVARAKGVPGHRILLHHALPNAIGPVLTQLGIQVGFLVASAVVVESIFGLPGVGSYLFFSVEQRDIYAVLGGVLTVGAMVVIANFAIDLLQMWRDPRLRAAQVGGA